MSWRSAQLDNRLCDQDIIILDLFQNKTVRYIGTDHEFASHLSIDNCSSNLVLILNQPAWLSEICTQIKKLLTGPVDTFYIGINRYTVMGNDTDLKIAHSKTHSEDLINFIEQIVVDLNYRVAKSGSYNNDRGRYFNFVQPLTWVYGVSNVAD
jgi:hypothetical protein